MHVNRIKPKDVFGLQFFFLLGISLLIGVTLEVIINDAGKGSIAYGGGDFLPALDTGVFFVVDEFGEAAAAKSMVAGLDSDWDGHYLIAEGTCNLFFDGFCEVAGRGLVVFLLLLLFLLLCLLLLLLLLPLRLVLLPLFFLLSLLLLGFDLVQLLLFLALVEILDRSHQLQPKPNDFIDWHLAGSEQPNLIQMRNLNSVALADLLIAHKGAIGAEVCEGVFVALPGDGAVLAAESLVVDADDALWVPADEDLGLGEGVSGKRLGVGHWNQAAPYLGVLQIQGFGLFQ